MRKTELLIEPITGEFAWKESIPEGFVSREEFINRTGIFVTPSQFGFIYDVDFKDSNMTVDEFISKFEENFSGEVMEVPLEGTFKYMVTDENISCLGEYKDDLHDPNIWEIINCLARTYTQEYESKLEMIEKYKKILEDVMETNKQCVEMIREVQLQTAKPTSEIAS